MRPAAQSTVGAPRRCRAVVAQRRVRRLVVVAGRVGRWGSSLGVGRRR
jgi:hypothetical protein